jgi:hypothetical protein
LVCKCVFRTTSYIDKQLGAPSGNTLEPNKQNNITQAVRLQNLSNGVVCFCLN